ncbi:hypothetical protein Patl1_23889 [Pistacia atlantica]|uniref:Uncharacterized protein n=1 Tax=Pistacia atlantica TaxID=434234 RepID=A0ACC0ZYT7_9ROSI|nr:hypothetical protein Patl1_23889 [Pistacia atlantica]
MAIKLSSLTFSNKILRWVNLTASISTLSSANTLQLTDFEVKIQSLRNKLCPDNLIRVLDTTGDVNSAVKIFKWVSLQKGFQHTADTYCKIILKLGLAGKVEQMEGVNEAIRVLVSMKLGGFKPSVDVFNVVLGAIVKEKRGFEDVVFIYKEMVKAGVVPNVDTLNFLLEVLFETGRIESALDQFRRMNKKGCSPNSRSYEIVIKGLILSNRVDDSVIVLGEMFDVGFEPELSFYTCIIPLFCWENKLEEGIRLFRMMRASNLLPAELTYRELIRCMCKNHRLDDANNLLEEMTENGITPAVDVLVDIVVGLCAIEKFDESVNFLEDKCGYITSPYNAMLEGCCNAGKFSLAKSILDKMAERNITDCDSWNILIRWLCENVEIRKANELLGVPSRLYQKLGSGFCIVLELVEGLCQAGKIIEAAEVDGCALDVEAYCILIQSMSAQHRTKDAVLFFNLMVNEGIDKLVSYCDILDSSMYNVLINGLWKEGLKVEASRLLDLMLEKGWVPDATTHGLLVGSFVTKDTNGETFAYEDSMQDNVSNILAEGLGNT